MSLVTCTTVEKVDAQAGNNKFYRTYVIDNWCIFQHGPRTIAPGGGRWIGKRHNSPSSAQVAARDKISEELRDGYDNKTVVTFDYPGTPSTNKADLQPLDISRQRAVPTPAPRPVAPPPAPAPAPPVAPASDHAAFTARALAAISLAITDPQAAHVEFGILNDAWRALEAQHGKAASYLKTLDQLLIGAP